MGKREKLYHINSQMGADIEKIVYISNFIAEKSDTYLESTVLAEIMQYYVKRISKNNEKINNLYNL